MDKILEALVDELAKRVLEKIGDDTSNMREFLRLKVKVEDVQGLDTFIDDRIDDMKGGVVSAAEDIARDTAEHVAREMIDSIEVEVESTASVNTR